MGNQNPPSKADAAGASAWAANGAAVGRVTVTWPTSDKGSWRLSLMDRLGLYQRPLWQSAVQAVSGKRIPIQTFAEERPTTARTWESVEPHNGNGVKRKPRYKDVEDGNVDEQQPQRIAEREGKWAQEGRQEKTPASAVVVPRTVEPLRGITFCRPAASDQTGLLYLQLGIRHGCVPLEVDQRFVFWRMRTACKANAVPDGKSLEKQAFRNDSAGSKCTEMLHTLCVPAADSRERTMRRGKEHGDKCTVSGAGRQRMKSPLATPRCRPSPESHRPAASSLLNGLTKSVREQPQKGGATSVAEMGPLCDLRFIGDGRGCQRAFPYGISKSNNRA
jgi:hypothetical protein